MENGRLTHELDLIDAKDLARIKRLLDCYYGVLKVLDEDSKQSLNGGATPYYKIKIELEENWI